MPIPSYKSMSLATLQTILDNVVDNKLLLVTSIGIITGTAVNWRKLPESEVNILSQNGENLAEFTLTTTDNVYSQYDSDPDYESNAISAIALKDVQILISGGQKVTTSSLIVYADQIIAASIASNISS